MRRRRFLYASLVAETNTFSNIPTAAADFESEGLLRGKVLLGDSVQGAASSVRGLANLLATKKIELAPSIFLHGGAGGHVQHNVYERYVEMIVEDFKAEAPIDAILLFLHGAMVSTECLDCEGDLLARLRAIAGPDVPIGVMLDPHAHLTTQMVDNSTVLIFMKEYPHTDGERMAEVVDVVLGTLDGRISPVAAVADCRLIGLFPTGPQPVRGFVDGLFEMERLKGVLSVSFVHGFPWGDTPDTGAKALVYTDGDPIGAAQLANVVRERLWAIREAAQIKTITLDDVARLLRSPVDGPLVFADLADNPGGGAPSDSTFVLRALIEAGGTESVALGFIYDPQSVAFCHTVGVGGHLNLRVGGKTGVSSGAPVDIDVEVMGLARDAKMSAFGHYDVGIGDTAWVRCGCIDIVLNTRRHQLYDPSGFSHIGIDPSLRQGLVVKSTNHFNAGFKDIARGVYYVSTAGAIDPDFARIPYRRLTTPFYPKVADPF